jgi:hypothetical protein
VTFDGNEVQKGCLAEQPAFLPRLVIIVLTVGNGGLKRRPTLHDSQGYSRDELGWSSGAAQPCFGYCPRDAGSILDTRGSREE